MSRIGHGLRRSRPVTAASLPVAGATCWIDFSDAATITLDGSSNISQANDKTGNGNHVLQATSANRPAFTTSTLIGGNTLTIARFDGANDELASSASVTAGGTTARTSFIAAVKRTSSFTSGDADVAMADPWSLFVASGPVLAIWRGSLTTVSSTTTDWTTAKVHTRQHNGSSTTQVWTNLTSRVSGSNASTTGTIRLGAESAANHGDWDIGEYIAYSSALGTTDREAVINYLMTKWSIT